MVCFNLSIYVNSSTNSDSPQPAMEITSMYSLIFIFLTTLFLYKLVFSRNQPKNLPPTLPSLPIIGHLHHLKRPLHRSLTEISKQLGPVIFLRFGSKPVLIVSSPSLAEECFTKNDIPFANRPPSLSGKYMGYNYTTLAWAPYGEHWRVLRRISTIEILSSTRIQMFSKFRTEEVKHVVKRLFTMCAESANKEGYAEMKSLFSGLTLNVMMMMIAGKRYYGENVEHLEASQRFKDILKEIVLLSGASNFAEFLPFLKWVKRLDNKFAKLREKRDDFLQELIEEHRVDKNKRKSNAERKDRTLIDVLLSLQEKEPEFYSDQMIRGTISVLLGAGTDTSSMQTEWVMTALLQNPRVLKKAQEEIDTNIGHDHLVDESDLSKLHYLYHIITETFRLYPVSPLLVPHYNSEDIVVGGYHVPRGTMLLTNMWSIHRDPKLWDEPTTFKPERFEGQERFRDGYKLVPFGAGRRSCPGEGLAMRVMSLVLATLLQCFDWEAAGELDMSESPGLVNSKALPLETKYKIRPAMLNCLSQL